MLMLIYLLWTLHHSERLGPPYERRHARAAEGGLLCDLKGLLCIQEGAGPRF